MVIKKMPLLDMINEYNLDVIEVHDIKRGKLYIMEKPYWFGLPKYANRIPARCGFVCTKRMSRILYVSEWE